MTTITTVSKQHLTPAALHTPLRDTRILLLAEHSPDVTALVLQLSADDVDVVHVRTAEMARVRLKRESPSSVLLCPELGEHSGYGALEQLRATRAIEPDCPAIAFSTRAEGIDRLRALQRGCLDFLALPIFYPELAARLQIAMARPVSLRSELRVPGGLIIDLKARTVRIDGQPIELSAKEYALAVTLSREPARLRTKAELIADIWGLRSSGRTRTLDSHACRLRAKLRAGRDGEHEYIHNVWGEGYRMLADTDL